MNASTALALVKTIQSNVAGARARLVERAVVVGRHDADHRRLDRLGAQRFEPVDELGRLLARPRDQDALAEQRPRVEPAQVLAQRGDAADDEDRRAAGRSTASTRSRDLLERAGDRLLRRQRAVVDERRRNRPAAGRARGARCSMCGSCCGPGVADDRAVEPREARPVDRRARLAFVLVAADERQRVAAAGIGERDARVARHADAGRNAGHDLERHALLVQEQRFGAAAVEHERIAPLQPRDDLALARLLGEQVADRFLLERLRRGDADVDLSRRPARACRSSRGCTRWS